MRAFIVYSDTNVSKTIIILDSLKWFAFHSRMLFLPFCFEMFNDSLKSLNRTLINTIFFLKSDDN